MLEAPLRQVLVSLPMKERERQEDAEAATPDRLCKAEDDTNPATEVPERLAANAMQATIAMLAVNLVVLVIGHVHKKIFRKRACVAWIWIFCGKKRLPSLLTIWIVSKACDMEHSDMEENGRRLTLFMSMWGMQLKG